MEALVAQLVFTALQLAVKNAPNVVASVQKMFSKGIPTHEEIEAERKLVAAITLDDVEVPAAPSGDSVGKT